MKWDFIKSLSFQNISFLGLSILVGNALSAFFWLYLADLLGTENYGELSYFLSIGGIVTAISLFGSEQAMTVFSAKKINIKPTIYLISLSTSSFSSIVLFFIFDNIGLSIYVLGYVLYNLALAEILGEKLYKNYSKNYLIQKILFIVLSIILYFVIGPIGVLLGYGFSFMFLGKNIFYSLKQKQFDFKILKNKFRFLMNNYILDISRVSRGQVDKLLIGSLFGFSLLGNYFLALQVLSVLGLIPGIIAKYTLPQDSSGISTTKIKIITIIFSIVLALIGIFVIPKLLPIFFPEYGDSLDLVPIMSLAIIPTTISSMLISKFQGIEKTGYVVISYFISFGVIVLGILILGNYYFVFGLALSLLLSSTCQAIYLIFVNFLRN